MKDAEFTPEMLKVRYIIDRSLATAVEIAAALEFVPMTIYSYKSTGRKLDVTQLLKIASYLKNKNQRFNNYLNAAIEAEKKK